MTNVWTLEAGRSFYLNGEPAFLLVRGNALPPTEADALCHRIVALLNSAHPDDDASASERPRDDQA